MGTPTLVIGDDTITIKIYDIVESVVTKSIIHDLAGSNEDVVQSMGKGSRLFKIRGTLYGDRTTNRILIRAGVNGYATFASEGVTSTKVFITNISFRERGDRPVEFDTELEFVEIRENVFTFEFPLTLA